MAKQTIDLDTQQPGGGLGDNARVAFGKTNDNFDDLYTRTGGDGSQTLAQTRQAMGIDYYGAEAPLVTFPCMTWADTGNNVVMRRNATDSAWVNTGITLDGTIKSAAYREAIGTGALYGRDSILGAVSQSSGVPTGAVIESGLSGSASYTKFADGTLICRGTLDNVNCDSVAGAVYRTASPIGITPPVEFADTSNYPPRAWACDSGSSNLWAAARFSAGQVWVTLFYHASITGRSVLWQCEGRWF